MKSKIAEKIGILVLIVAACMVYAFGAQPVTAGISVPVLTHQASKAATSTVSTIGFMTPGTGTTTVIWDARSFERDTALFHLRASTTALIYVNYEYSNGNDNGADCINNQNACDWYGPATSPVPVVGDVFLTMSSTTIQTRIGFGALASTTLIADKVPDYDANFRRVRVTMPTALGSGNATVRTEITHRLNAF